MNSWQIIFSQSRANGAAYDGDIGSPRKIGLGQRGLGSKTVSSISARCNKLEMRDLLGSLPFVKIEPKAQDMRV